MTYSARRGWLAGLTGAVVIGGLPGTAHAAGAPITAAGSSAAGSSAAGSSAAGLSAAGSSAPGSNAVRAKPGPDEPPRRRVFAGAPDRRMPSRSTPSSRLRTRAAAQVTGSLRSLDGECPVGLRRTATLYADGFEKGDLPEPTATVGFAVAAAGAVEGSQYAHSTLTTATVPAQDKQYHALFLPVVTTSPTARTVLSFKVRGDYGRDTAYVAVNESDGWIESSPEWSTVTVDLTTAVNVPGSHRPAGEVDARILNFPRVINGATTVDIDDVQIYQCAQPAATGVRGDFDGDRLADLLAVDTTGGLWAIPGRPGGRLASPLRIGHGWAPMTWVGSPGDLTGDRRPDVLARRTDGKLFLYAGYGMGSFSRAQLIGVGWNGVNAILAPGDTNGDRVPELIGRDAAGRLNRWSFAPGGRGLLRKTAIGVGFGSYARLVGPGDLNRDGRGDLIGVRPDGVMMSHYLDAAGRPGRATGLSQGWKIFTALAGPGDVSGDGRADLVARRGDGTLWSFLTPTTKATGVMSGSNANRFRIFG